MTHYSFATDPGSDNAPQQKKEGTINRIDPLISLISLQRARKIARLLKNSDPPLLLFPFNSHNNSTSNRQPIN
jgi:hypothetical protein